MFCIYFWQLPAILLPTNLCKIEKAPTRLCLWIFKRSFSQSHNRSDIRKFIYCLFCCGLLNGVVFWEPNFIEQSPIRYSTLSIPKTLSCVLYILNNHQNGNLKSPEVVKSIWNWLLAHLVPRVFTFTVFLVSTDFKIYFHPREALKKILATFYIALIYFLLRDPFAVYLLVLGNENPICAISKCLLHMLSFVIIFKQYLLYIECVHFSF